METIYYLEAEFRGMCSLKYFLNQKSSWLHFFVVFPAHTLDTVAFPLLWRTCQLVNFRGLYLRYRPLNLGLICLLHTVGFGCELTK